jgi:hypothetical protein
MTVCILLQFGDFYGNTAWVNKVFTVFVVHDNAAKCQYEMSKNQRHSKHLHNNICQSRSCLHKLEMIHFYSGICFCCTTYEIIKRFQR